MAGTTRQFTARRPEVRAWRLLLVALVLTAVATAPAASQPTPPPAGADGAKTGAPGRPGKKSKEAESLVTFPGGVVWQTSLVAAPAHPPAFDGQAAFVALKDDTLVAVSLDAGTLAWTVSQAASVPIAAAPGVVIGASDDAVWAREAATGAVRWTQRVGAAVVTSAAPGADAVVVGTAGDELVCLELATGVVRWRQAQGARPSAVPAWLGDRVVAGLADGRVMALAAKTGAAVWTRTTAAAVLSLSAANDRIYAGAQDNYLYVLAAKNGKQKWKWRTGGDVTGTAIVDRRRLFYVSLDNTLRAHNRRNGHLKWKRSLASRPAGGPLWIGDRVVVGGVAPELRAFQVADGAPAGVVGVPGRVLHQPYLAAASATQPARIIVVTGGGQIQAIGQTIEPPLVPLEALPGTRLLPDQPRR